jgi:hypothetical protein
MLLIGKIKRPNPICAVEKISNEHISNEHILYKRLGIRMAIIASNHQQGLNW